jgi:predicted dehydrogenase
MRRIILFTLALFVAMGVSAQEKEGQWKPVGNRKIRVVHWGICHAHSKGKWVAVKNLSDDFELLGWVDDTDSKAVRMLQPKKKNYAGYPCFTPEQVFNEIKPDLIVVETANDDLVGIATQVAEHGIAMHMDKPLGTNKRGFARISKICSERNIPIQIGYMFRTNDALIKMVEIAKSGIIGEVYSVEADMDHSYGNSYYPEYVTHYPGGIAYDLTCHLIDWVMPIFEDALPERTWSVVKPAPGDEAWAKTHTLTIMEYPRANVVMRTCSEGTIWRRHIRIDGSCGTIEMAPIEAYSKINRTTGVREMKSMEVRLYLKSVNKAAKEAGYKKGLNSVVYPALIDRYEGQLQELARIIRGEIPYPQELYEHDRRVHKVSLDAVKNIR